MQIQNVISDCVITSKCYSAAFEIRTSERTAPDKKKKSQVQEETTYRSPPFNFKFYKYVFDASTGCSLQPLCSCVRMHDPDISSNT